ncbi:MAG: tetratricopeptide repeat protein [Pirellulales bacterium]
MLAKRYEIEAKRPLLDLYSAASVAERIDNAGGLQSLRTQTTDVEDLRLALSETKNARRLCPFNYFAHLSAAQLCWLDAPPNQAAWYLERAERLAQGRSDWLFTIGALQLDAARFDDAWRAWREACQLQPSLADNVFALARGYLSPREALEKLLPSDPEVIAGLAVSLLNDSSDVATRSLYFEKALNLLNTDAHPTAVRLFVRGNALAELGRLEEADGQISQALRDGHARPEWYFELAAVRAALGKRQAADIAYSRYELHEGSSARPSKDYLERATTLIRRLPSPDAAALRRCADFYMELGTPAEAVTLYREVTKLRPSDADAFGGLATSLWQVGKAEEALEAVKTAVALKPTESAWRDLMHVAQESIRKKAADEKTEADK